MDVRVDEPGENDTPLKLDDARRLGREERYIRLAANSKDFIAGDGNGAIPVPLAVHRVDSAAAQHEIGAHKRCRCLLSQKEKTEEGEA